MFKRVKNSKLVYFLAFLVVISGIGGCGNWDKKDSKFLPTFQDRAAARTAVTEVKTDDKGVEKVALKDEFKDKTKDSGKIIYVNGLKVQVKDGVINFVDLKVSIPTADIKVSDADVIGFSSDIQKALRRRMDRARRVRLGSGSIQVIAAATGATLGLMTGDVATAAVFAAVSAIMPEFQHIFQAKERSDAYERGLELIQDADTRYYSKRTESNSIKTIPINELTKDGAALLSEIAACLKLVDKAILQTIPSIEDLEAATGRVKAGLSKITVVPNKLSLNNNERQTLRVVDSYAIAFSVDKIGIIEVTGKFEGNGTDTIDIKGTSTGTGKVSLTLFNRLGGSVEIPINVGKQNEKPIAKVVVATTSVKVGDTVELDGSGSSDPDKTDKTALTYTWEITAPQDSVAKIEKQEKKTSFIADKPGEYVVKLIVNDGQEDSDPSEVTITAEEKKKPTAKPTVTATPMVTVTTSSVSTPVDSVSPTTTETP